MIFFSEQVVSPETVLRMHAGTQRRQLTDSTFAYLRHANSCQKVVQKWCQIPNFGRCDQAAKDAKLSDTVASTTARLDRPPGCYMDTKTNTLFFNFLFHDYQGSDRFGILCEQCPKTSKGKLRGFCESEFGELCYLRLLCYVCTQVPNAGS